MTTVRMGSPRASFVTQWVKVPPVQVLAALLLIQFPDDTPGKALEGGPSTWALPLIWKILIMESVAPGFGLSQPKPILASWEINQQIFSLSHLL